MDGSSTRCHHPVMVGRRFLCPLATACAAALLVGCGSGAGRVVDADGALTITVPGRPSASPGDAMEVGGGVALEPGAARGDHDVAGVVVPAACAEKGVWVAGPVS
ncbi:hypothetical protein [Arthrobacter sp. NEB 688]|uniref:hypothetical protein n=1 Tax=Arthrobacter sp. NEB 688 TaxID=904039 RepID=UPI00156658BF|nr:hypothetical protein [Arthrobacter sp. NEB 688]QKE84200.1 hypothetical protein HL663_09790 [Arthrobacter sp. NEB 688]